MRQTPFPRSSALLCDRLSATRQTLLSAAESEQALPAARNNQRAWIAVLRRGDRAWLATAVDGTLRSGVRSRAETVDSLEETGSRPT